MLVAKTVSVTSMVDKYCKKKNITIHETPVGFKYIAKLMSETKILIGGEESGEEVLACIFRNVMVFLMHFFLWKLWLPKENLLKNYVMNLIKNLVVNCFQRRDLIVTPPIKKSILLACEKQPKSIGRFAITSVNTLDGYKFYIENGWLLIRPSGTEPLIKILC